MGFSGWDAAKEHRTKKNRKAFEKVRHLNKYGNFKGIDYEEQRMEDTKSVPNNRPALKQLLLILCLSMFALFFFWSKVENTVDAMFEENPREIEQQEALLQMEKKQAYRVLLIAGNKFFEAKRYNEAIDEAQLAARSLPNALGAKYLIAASYCELCIEKSDYCEKSVTLTDDFIALPKDEKKWKTHITHLTDRKADCLKKGVVQNSCDTVFIVGEKMSQFRGGEQELLKYNFNEIAPILSDFIEETGNVISKLKYSLVVSKTGEVIKANIKTEIPQKYKDRLKVKILAMPNWTPGEVRGEKVCMEVRVPINCIKWEDY